MKPPADGHRDGETYNAEFDYDRLNRQMKRVWSVMADEKWHTLYEIGRITSEPEASISARIRDLRKAKFGGHIVERRYLGDGTWEYRLAGRK